MGRIKTGLIKRVTMELVREHKDDLTDDFEKNKQLIAGFVDLPSKKIRNVIAGYVTRLVKGKEEILEI